MQFKVFNCPFKRSSVHCGKRKHPAHLSCSIRLQLLLITLEPSQQSKWDCWMVCSFYHFLSGAHDSPSFMSSFTQRGSIQDNSVLHHTVNAVPVKGLDTPSQWLIF